MEVEIFHYFKKERMKYCFFFFYFTIFYKDWLPWVIIIIFCLYVFFFI